MTISITSSHLHGIEKLKGASNYMTWKNAMETVMQKDRIKQDRDLDILSI